MIMEKYTFKKKYEYKKVLVSETENDIDVLNKYGEDRWQLSSIKSYDVPNESFRGSAGTQKKWLTVIEIILIRECMELL